MIDVIIPYMPRYPYTEYLSECIEVLKNDKTKPNIIVSQHDTERWIHKNNLINVGISLSKSDTLIIWDVDIRPLDEDTISNSVSLLNNHDIVFFSLYFDHSNRYKFCEGVYAVKRSVMYEFGPHDECLIGIGGVTFPFLHWILKNKNWKYGGKKCLVSTMPVDNRKEKRHNHSYMKTESIRNECINKLKSLDIWSKIEPKNKIASGKVCLNACKT